MRGVLISVYENKRAARTLQYLSRIPSVLIAAAFAFVLCFNVIDGLYRESAVIASCALSGYILVSIARRLINAKRPYEEYSFYEVKPGKREGCSFPSRHAYSAFSISVLTLSFNVYLAIALFVLAALLCVCRVLLGIHYVRDVVCGALIGALAGVIGIVIL